MLYAASVKVNFRNHQRRIDVIVEAEDLERAKTKAVKQARNIYTPAKKATYTINEIISEAEAAQTLKSFPTQPMGAALDNPTE